MQGLYVRVALLVCRIPEIASIFKTVTRNIAVRISQNRAIVPRTQIEYGLGYKIRRCPIFYLLKGDYTYTGIKRGLGVPD